METAPTSLEVLLRPTLSQSDEPSDLRGSLSPTSVYSTWQSPGGHPSNYEPGATLLNFSDRANHDKRTPYSAYKDGPRTKIIQKTLMYTYSNEARRANIIKYIYDDFKMKETLLVSMIYTYVSMVCPSSAFNT